MTTRFPTISFCPTCYAEVSASVTVGREGVTMNKSCPHHGQFTSMVERDPLFYQAIRGLRAPSIYDGYFVDVTRRCNLRCEFCLPPEAPVLMADLSSKQIKDIQVGDKLVGFPEKKKGTGHIKLQESVVTAVHETFQEAVEIETTFGTIVSSPNHKWLSNRRWREAGKFKPGQYISMVAPVADKPEIDDDFKKGYFAGVSLGDGTIDHRKQKGGKYDKQYYRLALTDFDILDRAQSFASDLGVNLFRSDYHHSPSVLVQCKSPKPMQKLTIAQKQAILTIESWFIDNGTDSYRKGFISGFFDAEGSCEQRKKVLRISQTKPNGLLDRVDSYLKGFGFKVSRDPKGTRLLGGQMEVLRFFITFDPACKRKFNLKSYNVRGRAVVKSVKNIPARKMRDITTTTATFVAYGLATHNCFYHLETTDPEGEYSIPAILNECAVSRHRAPFIITGGEPTTREDIGEVIRNVRQIGPVELLTNGTGLTKPELWTELVPLLTNEGTDTINVNLSLHVKETDAWREVVNRCRAEGVKLESALIVINSKEEFWEAMTLCKELSDVVECYRIKAASRIWNEQKPEGKIFVSDMYRWLEESGKPVVLVPQRHNKVSIVNVAYDRMHLMLVSWYDVSNIDLVDVDCAPYYRARNGEVQNFVTSCLINEGIERGFMKGRKISK